MDSYSPSHTTINHHSTGSDPCPINYTNIDPTRNACSRSARLPSLWFAFSLKQCLQSWDQSAPAGRDGTRADPMNFAPRGCLQLTNFVVQNLKKQGQMIEASATILFIAVYNCISIIQCVCVVVLAPWRPICTVHEIHVAFLCSGCLRVQQIGTSQALGSWADG